MEIDRRLFIASLGGAATVASMSHEARAEALEHYMSDLLEEADDENKPKFPTAAELEAQIETRPSRRGAGGIFVAGKGNVQRLAPLPAKPTLLDFYNLRFTTVNHCLQSATDAMKKGQPEEIVLACLIHDVVQTLMKTDHGWWGAQMFEPYVSPKVAFAIRYHQALRFYPDPATGYEYPDLYRRMFGEDYTPPPHIQQAYKYAKDHKWYMAARLVTVHDLYAFDPSAKVSMDPFVDIIGRGFKQPKEGLGNDNSPVAHFWRTMAFPDTPL
ncbi:MAG TPA: hypothetical protein VKU01_18310 [Bryobacteraceae bacterium]|nr:hypothetical protein [Bryobacteraceae bacterium]